MSANELLRWKRVVFHVSLLKSTVAWVPFAAVKVLYAQLQRCTFTSESHMHLMMLFSMSDSKCASKVKAVPVL